MRIPIILAAVSTLAVSACSEIVVPGQDTTPVPGNYLVRTVNGTNMPEGVTFTLQPDGQFAGKGPCNDYNGASARPLPGFQATRFASTRKMCDANTMRFEQMFFTALTQANSLTQGAMSISLSNNASGSDGQNIMLRRMPVTTE